MSWDWGRFWWGFVLGFAGVVLVEVVERFFQ